MRPIRACAAPLALALAVLLAGPAPAIPPPMSPADLEKNSDVIATVKVRSVTCTKEVEARGGKVLAYQAQLEVVEVKKGTVKPGDVLTVEWQDIPKGLVGPWKVDYFAGEKVTTHLKYDAEKKVYATTWWNAKGKSETNVEMKLPAKPGETISAE
jgi:hypothetical protein